MDELRWKKDSSEKIFLGGDLNGQIGKDGSGYEKLHKGHSYGKKNETGNKILDFVMSFDPLLATAIRTFTWTKKNGIDSSQIDSFLTMVKNWAT